jgi:CubicO group peptidase (beta-lactamase class C family)
MPDTLDNDIEQARADWKNVGVAVALVRGDEVVYTRGFGRRECAESASIDADTLFQVGSTSKAFTTAALGILVDEAKIGWDEPVIEWVPEFQLQDPWLTRHLTIRDAVAHRSGIPDSAYPFMSVMGPERTLRQLRYITPIARFRDSYCYSNLMYALAGRIIEAASGTTWHDFIRQRLLQPLKMNRSGTSASEFWAATKVAPTFFGSASSWQPRASDASDSNVAMPHGVNEDGSAAALAWQSYDNAAAAGSLVSSVADMANWLILNLNGGCFEGKQIIRPNTLRELHATQNLHVDVNQFPFENARETYALGWRRSEYRGYTHLAHSGGIMGFPAYVAMLPEAKVGIVVLSNGSLAERDPLGLYKLGLHKAIAFRALDSVLKAPSRAWSEELMSLARSACRQAREQEGAFEQARLPRADASLPMRSYAGSFEDRSGHSDRVTVQALEDRLTLTFSGEGAYSAQLEHWHRDLFRLRSQPGAADVLGRPFVSFTLDAKANVASMFLFGATFHRI